MKVLAASPCSASEWKPDYSITPRHIVCAAVIKEGRIITGARHFDKIMRSQMKSAEGVAWWQGCQQGFIDQFGDFLSRQDAWVVATGQAQIRREVSSIRREVSSTGTLLYSENLY